MVLEEIYKRLKSEYLCESAYDFSANYLGKSKSYYSVLKARNEEPSIDVLVMLELSLKERATVYEGDKYEFYKRVRGGLLSLSDEVKSYRDQRCISRLRENLYGMAA